MAAGVRTILERFPGQNILFNLQPDQNVADLSIAQAGTSEDPEQIRAAANIDAVAQIFRIRPGMWHELLLAASHNDEHLTPAEDSEVLIAHAARYHTLGSYMTDMTFALLPIAAGGIGQSEVRARLRAPSGRIIDFAGSGDYWTEPADQSDISSCFNWSAEYTITVGETIKIA